MRESELRLTEIIDFLPDATFVIDCTGKVIIWNKAIEKMTGVMARDMLGKGDCEYALPFYGVRRPLLVDLAFKTDEELAQKYFNVHKDGEVLTAEANVSIGSGPLRMLWGVTRRLYNREGRVIGAIESIRDTTERKNAEAALVESRNFLDKIINTMADPIFVKDRRHCWVLLNEALCNFVGFGREKLLGRSDYDFFPKEQADIFWEKDEAVYAHRGGKHQRGETDRHRWNHLMSSLPRKPCTGDRTAKIFWSESSGTSPTSAKRRKFYSRPRTNWNGRWKPERRN